MDLTLCTDPLPQLIEAGSQKLASVPSGGGGGGAGASSGGAGAAAGGAAEEKKEEEKEEEKEVSISTRRATLRDQRHHADTCVQESDDDMGFGLFD